MDDRTPLRDRLIELAKGEASVLSLVQTAEDDFVLRFESGIDVEVENLTDSGHAALSSVVGTPLESERLRVYEAMLIYGLLWRDNGGVHMALTGPAGALVQLAEIQPRDLTQGELMAVIKNFEEKAVVWRDFLAPDAASDPAPQFFELELRA